MNSVISRVLKENVAVHDRLLLEESDRILAACRILADALRAGRKLLVFGNGGSAADAQHLAAELVGRFVVERVPLPAVALTVDSSILTAVANDYGYDQVFSRQVVALGAAGDVACGISTSGGSRNVLNGLEAARAMRLRTLALTGRRGGPVADVAEVAIRVPSDATARIQEAHATICHILCEAVEVALFGGGGAA
ncbi:MAG: SIS domain-containing protein [Pseudomonadota bacterium]